MFDTDWLAGPEGFSCFAHKQCGGRNKRREEARGSWEEVSPPGALPAALPPPPRHPLNARPPVSLLSSTPSRLPRGSRDTTRTPHSAPRPLPCLARYPTFSKPPPPVAPGPSVPFSGPGCRLALLRPRAAPRLLVVASSLRGRARRRVPGEASTVVSGQTTSPFLADHGPCRTHSLHGASRGSPPLVTTGPGDKHRGTG